MSDTTSESSSSAVGNSITATSLGGDENQPSTQDSPSASSCPSCEKATINGNDTVSAFLNNFSRAFSQNHPQKSSVRASSSRQSQYQQHSYCYEPLADQNYTRLLKLEPGNGDDPIRCNIQEMDIDHPPKYTALSYTWGRADEKLAINVDRHDFLIRNNLWNALWHIRSRDDAVAIWVDAICINQDNIDERNYTVRRMKDIYERADHVTVWLGADSDGSGAMSLLGVADIYDKYTKLVDKLGTHSAALDHLTDYESWVDEKHAREVRYQWWAVDILFQRTWFHRMWALQEGSSPVPTTFQVCEHTVPSTKIYEVFKLLLSVPADTFPRKDISSPGHIQRMEALTALAESRRELHVRSRQGNSRRSGKSAVRTQAPGIPLLEVLHLARHQKTSDPHDKVYAALGFAADEYTFPINIDYRKPLSEMLQDVAVACFQHDPHPLRFLGHAGLNGTGHMPASWVPDWLHRGDALPFPKETSHLPINQNLPLYNASLPSHPIWQQKYYKDVHATLDATTLRIPGILIDYVHTLSVEPGRPDTMSTLETIWTVPRLSNPYASTTETRESAFLRTLVADLTYSNGKVTRGGTMHWRDTPSRPPNHASVETTLSQICNGRKFVQTLKHGYFGLGSAHALQGDAIFMLQGGEMLYLARPTMQGTYHFVGEVYVHGLMDGAVVEDFSRGEGKLQMVEFVPVKNDVTDRMEAYVHADVGPSAEDALKPFIQGCIDTFFRQGLGIWDALMKTVVDPHWANVAEHALCKEYPVTEAGTSRPGIAGRRFARRSYVRAAIAQGKSQIGTMLIGRGQNKLPNGEILALDEVDVEFVKGLDEDPRDPEEVRAQQLRNDEVVARRLQEEEMERMKTREDMPIIIPIDPQLNTQDVQEARDEQLEQMWRDAVQFGSWEGDEEAEMPAEFVMV